MIPPLPVRSLAAALVVVLSLCPKVLTAADSVEPGAGNWMMFGNGPTHSGFYPTTLGDVPVTEGWSKTYPAGINQVAVVGQRVFLTTSRYFKEAFAAALDTETGAEVWHYPLQSDATHSGPTVIDGQVLFLRNHGGASLVFVLDSLSGQLVRQIRFETQGENSFGPTVSGDGIWIRGGYFGGIQGFNLSDGSPRFSSYLNPADDWTPTYDGKALYVCVDGVFSAWDPQTGASLWKLDFRRPSEILLFAAQPVVAGNKASMISFGRTDESSGNALLLTTIDTATKSIVWRQPDAYYYPGGTPLPKGFSGIPATDGQTVFAISGSTVHAFDANSGHLRGIYQADNALSGQPLVTNDRVIVSSTWTQEGQTYVFDKNTYQLKAALRHGGKLSLVGDTLYIAGRFIPAFHYLDGGTATLCTYRFRPGIAPAPLAPVRNLSTRLSVGLGDRAAIAGFIITGTSLKRLMLRGIGPSLLEAGVANALPDPGLGLNASANIYPPSGNDDWQTTQIRGSFIGSDQASIIQASGLAPKHPKESAMIVGLPPGAYTLGLNGFRGTTGVGLVEVYDLNPDSGSKLANISSRAFIGPGDLMIAGFILGYQETGILARAISVATSFPGIGDPTLELYDGNGTVLAFNDNWKDTQQSEIEATTIPPKTDLESAIVRTLAPGAYTAILRGASDMSSGGALVEIYSLP